MQKFIRHFGFKSLAVCGVFAFLSCASRTAVGLDSFQVYYSDSKAVPLVNPQKNTETIEENLHISAVYGDKKFSSDAWMRLDDSTVHMMVFSSMGNVIAEIVCTGDSLSMHSKWMDVKKVKPEYVVADIQFCYYPTGVLKENFHSSGFSFEEVRDGEKLTRTLSENGNLILKMEKNGKQLVLENFLRRYSYRIMAEGDL